MAPKKEGGTSKGKRPTIALLESEDEGNAEDQRVIQEQLAELERAQGLSPGASSAQVSASRGQMTWQAAQRQFQSEGHNCLLCLD